jgi:putative ABC transport system permease protein
MWRNYLTVCVRSLTRNRTYAFINIFGLTVGLAACLLVLLYIRYEQSYDSWLADADRTFQLQQWSLATEDNLYPGGMQMTSYVSGERLRQFPQVEQVVYVSHLEPVILQDGEGTLSKNFAFVNGPLFDVLGVPFVRGNPRTALASPGSMVLTEAEARRRFATTDVVGRTLAVVAGGKTTDYRIGGVVKDLPKNSHLALSVVARVDFEGLYGGQVPFLTEWMPKNGWVYARLKPGADVAEIARQMPAWERRNIPDEIVGGERMNPGTNVDWRLVNVRDIHLGEAQDGSMRPGNDRGTIVALAAVGSLILLLAVVNFVNLATARASLRAREVALRKTLGATRRQLIVQFLAESILVTAFSMLLALALVELLLPSLNAFLDAEIPMRYTGGDGLLLPVLGLVLLVGGAGGLYPAFVLSGFRPATVLRANRSSADTAGSGRLRNVLVVGQFAVSIGLIICTAIIYAQTAFARTVDPGYRRDGILQVGNLYRAALLPRLDTLLHEARQVQGVSSVGRSTIGVATWGMENMTVTAPGAAEGVEFELYRVDPGFFPTLGIRTIAGRTFAETRAMDDSTVPDPTDEAVAAMARRGYNVVINELAARRLGFNRPEQAIGKTLLADDGDVEIVGPTPATVIGVVGNSRFRSIRDPVQPMIFLYDRLQPSYLLIRYSGNPAEIRARIEAVWKRIAPEVPFEAEFSEQIVQQLYDPEEARGMVFAAFAVLAIIVACLGLFGLAAFVAERRTKEIGIRKVFGATVRDIVKLLTWQFSKPVVLANLIAWPVAWWVMRDWLNGFDVRIQLGLEPFILAGFIAIVIAIGTVAGHAISVGRTNPIHALRYE